VSEFEVILFFVNILPGLLSDIGAGAKLFLHNAAGWL